MNRIGTRLMWIFLGLLFLEGALRVGGVVYPGMRDRGTDGADQGLVDTYRILCLGESTTATGGRTAWPAQLEDILNERSSGRHFKVINEGVGGTNTAFILQRLDGNLERHAPHMVIAMMGGNDSALHFRYDARPRSGRGFSLGDVRVIKLGKLIVQATWSREEESIEDVLNDEGGGDSSYYLKKGDALLRRNRINEAETMYRRAIEVDPDDELAYADFGEFYHEMGRFDEAEAMFRKAVEMNPNNGEVYTDLGIFLLGQMQWKEGEWVLEKAVELYRRAGAHGEGRAHETSMYGADHGGAFSMEEREDAIDEMGNAFVSLGRYYLDHGRVVEAEAVLEEFVKFGPDEDAYVTLGMVYAQTQRYQEAEEMFKKALEIDPACDVAYTQMGYLLGVMNAPTEDLEELYEARGVPIDRDTSALRNEITGYHYQVLYRKLGERGVKLVAMQYPTRDVCDLREMLQGIEDVIFVSNKENFRKTLAEGRYEDYFLDRCYETFGHATPAGNRLIAESAADAVLRALESGGG